MRIFVSLPVKSLLTVEGRNKSMHFYRFSRICNLGPIKKESKSLSTAYQKKKRKKKKMKTMKLCKQLDDIK